MTSETPLYDKGGNIIGFAKGNEIIYLPDSNPKPNKKPGQKDKGLTEMLGGAFRN